MYVLMVSCGYPTERYPQNGIFAFDQASALNNNTDIDVKLAVIDLRSARNKRDFGIHFKTVRGVCVAEISVPIGAVPDHMYEMIGNLGFRYLFGKIVKKFGRPNLIHAQFGNMGIVVASVCRKYNIPLIVTEHSSSLNQSTWSKNFENKYINLFNYADRVLAVSNSLKRHIEDKTNVPVTVIPNVVDLKCFSYVSEKRQSDNFRFVAVGNLIKLKNFDLLLDAFADACKTRENVFLDIIGDGPLKSHLQEKIDFLGLGDRVALKGRLTRTEIAQIYKYSDAFILLSNSETFGVAYVEAMACGLPVIATKCGGPEDFVNEENGILVDVGDVHKASAAISNMLGSIDQYDRQRISNYVKTRYSAESIATSIYEIYMGVI